MKRLVRNVSLRELLVCVTCFAIGSSHVITSLRLSRANAELAALRQRLELIPVDDTNHLAARRLPSSDKQTKRWTIRIPSTVEKQLYVNWGSGSIAAIRDPRSPTVRSFPLKPDPATHETSIAIRVELNEAAPSRGTLKIELPGNTQIIAIDAELASLLLGRTASGSEEIGDKPVVRQASSAITLFATEAKGGSPFSFCIWLDQPPLSAGR
ncbi:MAG: hypothetical protein U1A77_11155 [Pirellulales bacterium]